MNKPQQNYEDILINQIIANNLPPPTPQFKFHPHRKYKFDLAYPQQKIAIEIEGATYTIGRHQQPTGFTQDCLKYNLATLLGWSIFRVTPTLIKKGYALELVKEVWNEFSETNF